MPGRLASSSSKMPPGKRRRKQGGSSVPPLPPDIADEDVDISDEDVEFVRKHTAYAGFLANLDTKSMTRQVLGLGQGKDGDDLETHYEHGAKREKDPLTYSVDPVDVLPVKTLGGQLHYRSTSTEDPVDWSTVSLSERRHHVRKGANKATPEDMDVEGTIPDELGEKGDKKSKAERRKERKQLKRVEAQQKKEASRSSEPERGDFIIDNELERGPTLKARMAEIGMGLLSDPNGNIMTMKELQDMCADRDEDVAQLAILSSMAIFKDLIPGYRIRLPTEKEKMTTVSKEVRSLWDFETALLHFYQAYVRVLVRYAKVRSMRKTAVRCLCGLLEAVPHFNYRESILSAVIPRMDSNDDECSKMSCDAIVALFKNPGKHGDEGTVEAVQLIADFVKLRKCHLHPRVIQVFQYLSFDDDLLRDSMTGAAGQSLHEGHQKMPQKMSKRQEKKDKKAKKRELASVLRKQVKLDFQEASALPEIVAHKKVQMLILSSLFEIYFRILKTSLDMLPERASVLCEANEDGKAQLGPRPLLRPCLEGLAKFSHLINVDFMADLLGVLQALARGGNVSSGSVDSTITIWDRLQCCTVACSIVRLNMDALNIDLREFYTIFYNLLPEAISIRDEAKNGEVLAHALQVMLWDGRHSDMHRVAAFLKQMSTLALHTGSREAVSVLVTMQQLLVRYKKCRNMVESNHGTGFSSSNVMATQTEVDPDLSDALSASLWELTLLAQHYNPDVAKYAAALSSMSISSSVALPTETPSAVVKTFSTLFPIVVSTRQSLPRWRKQTKSSKHAISSLWMRWMSRSGLQDVQPLVNTTTSTQKLFTSHFKVMRACKTIQRQSIKCSN